jgi:hypothetical protein
MKINLRIELNTGESKEITCSAADLVAFETKYDISVTALESGVKYTHLLFLAWTSEKRRKETTKDFESWIEDVASVGASDSDPKSKG